MFAVTVTSARVRRGVTPLSGVGDPDGARQRLPVFDVRKSYWQNNFGGLTIGAGLHASNAFYSVKARFTRISDKLQPY